MTVTIFDANIFHFALGIVDFRNFDDYEIKDEDILNQKNPFVPSGKKKNSRI